ncbi:hypothetical protein ACIOD2_25815 [Amycolatopsis sp. NPDC088138]|uniref:hypothetical protein n=1 Tax=Amycolatopsis sp. NPDC088138 TaxID=3363938 RepID=UPI0038101671
MSDATDFLFEQLGDARAETTSAQDKITSVAYLVGYYDLLADTTNNDGLGDMVRDLKAALRGTLDADAIGKAGR